MLLWETLASQDCGPHASDENCSSVAIAPKRLPFDKRCSAMTKAGRRCRGRIREGTEFCPFHDPTVTAKRRQALAAKGGRSHHKLAHIPDGYLRKLTDRCSIGHAMDRLYREIRLGVVTPQMGTVLFNILTRLLDSGLSDNGVAATSTPHNNRSKADRLRPKLSQLLTHAERRAWREAATNAPGEFYRDQKQQAKTPSADRNRSPRHNVATTPQKIALPAAS